METNYIANTKHFRAMMHHFWVERKEPEKAKEVVLKPLREPLFSPELIHPEDVSTLKNINHSTESIGFDLAGLDADTSNMALRYRNLLDDVQRRLDRVKDAVQQEYDRLEENNILCHRYSDFSNITGVNLFHDAKGQFSIYGQYAALPESLRESTEWRIERITGNGYAGNEYAFNQNREPLSEMMATDNAEVIKENSDLSAYEYSRLTASTSEPVIFKQINRDQTPVKMTMDVRCDQLVNHLVVHGGPDVIVSKIMTSADGARYADTGQPPTLLKDNHFFSFLPARYVRLFLESQTVTQDIVGFETPEGEMLFPQTAKRSVITLHHLELFRVEHLSKTSLDIPLKVNDKLKAVAIYSEELIPSHFPRDNYIVYELFVNEMPYLMSTVNSHREGVNVIFSQEGTAPRYRTGAVTIPEDIKSLHLRIHLRGHDNQSPYFRYLKIMKLTAVEDDVI